MKFQISKGTFDILPYGADEPWKLSYLWQYVEEIIRRCAFDYGYREIRTPIYERTELFDRGVGETSDIVMKEMFTFQDKGGRSISLRPEGTSSVMRAFVENNLAQTGPVHKFFYIEPMFRYERPQSGRYRQHHQFGVEALGVAAPAQDAEVIDLLCETYRRLGLKNLKVQLNSVGDAPSRIAYKDALQAYLRPLLPELSEESRARFEKNPLRILDSKDPKDREFLQSAPSILRSLSSSAKEHFDELRRLLDECSIPYEINDRIVRGLDYYNKTVFEITAEVLGAQNAVGGGGRYDGLIASFGGPDLPGVGFGTGIERILQIMLAQNVPLPSPESPFLFLLPLGDEARRICFSMATECRHRGVPTEIDLYSKKIQAGLQNAARLSAHICAIIGSEEIAKGIAQIKYLDTRLQEEVTLDCLVDNMAARWKSYEEKL
jgi:histidyl-tRNA synthetase